MAAQNLLKLSRRALIGGGAAAVAVGGSAYALRSNARMQRHAVADAWTLNRGNGAEPNTLDPHLAVTAWENNIIGDMFMGLMTEDPAARPVPGAAERYAVSEDGLTYTFTLREHCWSDGVKVTAHDFVFAFRRILDPDTAAQYASMLYPIVNAEAINAGRRPPRDLGVRALDDRTLEIRFHYEVPYFAQLVMHAATYPLPRHAIEKYGKNWLLPENIVTNGAYILREWVANDHLTLTKNPRFYAQKSVKIETVHYYPTPDAAASLKRFRGGEFDVLSDSVAPQQTQWLKREIPNELKLTPFAATKYITFNVTRKPFDDVRVREALSLAIDREILVDKITRGGERAAYSLVPPQMPGYPGKPALRFHGDDRHTRHRAARQLLAEAGYGQDRPLEFTFNIQMQTEAKIVGVTLQEMWRMIGVNAHLLLSEGQVHYDLLRRRDFETAWCAWSADYLDAKDFLFLLASSTKEMNFGEYRNPLYDRLLAQSDLERDPALRAQLLEHAEQRMLDDNAIAPVYHGVTRDLVSTEVKGWAGNLINVNRSRYLSLERAAADA